MDRLYRISTLALTALCLGLAILLVHAIGLAGAAVEPESITLKDDRT